MSIENFIRRAAFDFLFCTESNEEKVQPWPRAANSTALKFASAEDGEHLSFVESIRACWQEAEDVWQEFNCPRPRKLESENRGANRVEAAKQLQRFVFRIML